MKHITFKRILSLALSLLMILSLVAMAACGKKDDDDDRKDRDDDDEIEETETEKETLNPEQNKFASALGGVSETFTGAVSEETYDSPEEAATAFIDEELVGDKDADIQSVKTKELSDREISKLDIPAALLNGSDAVEEVEVEYTVEDDDTLESRNGLENLAKLNKSKKIKVYVIKYGTDWKYFSPMPVTGDTISKSYYDSVFQAERYKNCTLESTGDVTAVITADGQTMEMTIKTYQLIKHADGKIYMEQKIDMDQFGSATNQIIYAYMEEQEDGTILCYVKLDEDEDWFETSFSSIGFTSLEQLAPFYDQYLDYTYFTKTDFGFALSDENARSYFTQALGDALGSMNDLIDPDKMKLDMYAEYYVSEGVLSGMRVDADVNMTINEGGSTAQLTEKVSNVTTCTDYGTTVVEKPFTE